MTAEYPRKAAAKRAGDAAEAAVIQRLDALEAVPDTEAEHYDARTTRALTYDNCTLAGAVDCPEGTPVEIKSVAVVYGKSSANGRFYLRARQHEHLRAREGFYVFAVCTPDPNRELLAVKAVPAAHVDVLVSSWIDVDGDRAEEAYAQLAWTRLFDESEVTR